MTVKSGDEIRAHLDYFRELGVSGVRREKAWSSRPGYASVDDRDETDAVLSSLDQGVEVAQSYGSLRDVRDDIGDCTRCQLHEERTNVVFGVGDDNADLMFVGEAPGRDEDLKGEPFVGRAGQLLTKIIEAIDLNREDVYIANVVKCRPPKNRNPAPAEIATCQPFLRAQIAFVKPKVIVALGAFAAKTLLNDVDTPISGLRGKVFDFCGAKLIPTFHPAYLLRSPDRKRDVWEDMKKVRGLLRVS